MPPLAQLEPGSVFGGEYRIVKPLSAGGMGAVYVAEQTSTGKLRAVKLMHPALLADARLRERFEQEARVGALIKSDHVVQVLGAGVDAATGVPWLSMELLEGEDLAAFLRRRGAVTPNELYEIFRQIGHALGAAHAVGVVHRDLKPENIFLAQTPSATGVTAVKILDFGIAKLVAEAKNTATAAIGSPLWMAPEQTDPRAQISTASDVWPLGLIAFTMLTGRLYWLAANDPLAGMTALMREILFEPLAPATTRAAELQCGGALGPAFDAWFSRCLERDPRQRFASAAEALAALGPALFGGSAPAHSVMPPPPSSAPSFSSGSYPGPASHPPHSAPASYPSHLLHPSYPSHPSHGANSAHMAPRATSRSGAPLLVAAVVAVLVGSAAALALFAHFFRAPVSAQSANGDVARFDAPSPPVTSRLEPGTGATVIMPANLTPAPPPTGAASARAATASMSAATAKPTAKAAAPRPFDYPAATTALQQAGSRAKFQCKGRPGPLVVSATVFFNPAGAVQRTQMDPQVMATSSGICVMSALGSTRVPPFDGSDLKSMPTVVGLD